MVYLAPFSVERVQTVDATIAGPALTLAQTDWQRPLFGV